MSFEKSVELAIREAQERGDFDNLKGKGKPINLDAYFETPEDVRMAYSILKSAAWSRQRLTYWAKLPHSRKDLPQHMKKKIEAASRR